MDVSVAPLAVPGERALVVWRVREYLNVPGDDLYDSGLAEVVRGHQRALGLEPTGWIDDRLLQAFDIDT